MLTPLLSILHAPMPVVCIIRARQVYLRRHDKGIREVFGAWVGLPRGDDGEGIITFEFRWLSRRRCFSSSYRNQQVTRVILLSGGFDTLLTSFVTTQPPISHKTKFPPRPLTGIHHSSFCLHHLVQRQTPIDFLRPGVDAAFEIFHLLEASTG